MCVHVQVRACVRAPLPSLFSLLKHPSSPFFNTGRHLPRTKGTRQINFYKSKATKCRQNESSFFSLCFRFFFFMEKVLFRDKVHSPASGDEATRATEQKKKETENQNVVKLYKSLDET
jgi:hypothetical protein